ncbi:MAG TPA: carboxypeptidase regulatory-like domain-containing protein [Planctomycetota bacterium]|nr:carboxypeptidase regulatory-like domain-containing protein [Planctomycetota bacterium]
MRGRVLRGNLAVAGVSVHLLPRNAEVRPDLLASHARTTARDGSYSIEDVPPGPAVLSVDVPDSEQGGSVPRRRTIAVPDAAELVFDVQLAGGRIRGRVLRASDASPVRGVLVMALPEEASAGEGPGASTEVTLTDEEGRYRVEDLEPGRYHVRAQILPESIGALPVRSDDKASLAGETRGPFEVAQGIEAIADFSLRVGGTAIVSVVDPKGEPVPDAFVRVVPAASGNDDRAAMESKQWQTDGNGIARVLGLSEGAYYAVALFQEWAGTCSQDGTVRTGEETEFPIFLRKGTRVRVRILDEGGAPVRRAFAQFTDAGGHLLQPTPVASERLTASGERGASVAVLLPGEYTLKVEAEGYLGKSIPVRVGADSPQDLVVHLEREGKPR